MITPTASAPLSGGTFTLPDGPTLNRIGFGAMQLAGPGVFGPPADPERSRTVLRDAVAHGINHIDTSDFYGPHVVNRLIREALSPYPDELCLVTKVGGRRDEQGNASPHWPTCARRDWSGTWG